MTTILLFLVSFIAAIALVIAGSVFLYRYNEKKKKRAFLLMFSDLGRLRGVYFNFGLFSTVVVLFCAFNYKVEFTTPEIIIEEDTSKKDVKTIPITVQIPKEVVVNIESLDIEEVPDEEIVKEIKKIIVPDDFIPTEEGDIDDLFSEFGEASEKSGAPRMTVKTESKFKGIYEGITFKQFSEKHQVYPMIPQEEGISGTVTVQVKTDAKGNLLEPPKAIKSPHPDLGKEAVRLVEKSFTDYGWAPAKMNGNPVPFTFYVTVDFNIGG